MKKGKIAVDEATGVPGITCSFHNSKFRLDNGTLPTMFATQPGRSCGGRTIVLTSLLVVCLLLDCWCHWWWRWCATGACVAWCTGVMGIPGTAGLGQAMGKVGGAHLI